MTHDNNRINKGFKPVTHHIEKQKGTKITNEENSQNLLPVTFLESTDKVKGNSLKACDSKHVTFVTYVTYKKHPMPKKVDDCTLPELLLGEQFKPEK